MKKTLLIAALSLLLTACKKDRVCNCTITVKKPGATTSQTYEQSFTMTKTKLRPAVKACSHTRTEETTNGKTTSVDRNCALQ